MSPKTAPLAKRWSSEEEGSSVGGQHSSLSEDSKSTIYSDDLSSTSSPFATVGRSRGSRMAGLLSKDTSWERPSLTNLQFSLGKKGMGSTYSLASQGGPEKENPAMQRYGSVSSLSRPLSQLSSEGDVKFSTFGKSRGAKAASMLSTYSKNIEMEDVGVFTKSEPEVHNIHLVKAASTEHLPPSGQDKTKRTFTSFGKARGERALKKLNVYSTRDNPPKHKSLKSNKDSFKKPKTEFPTQGDSTEAPCKQTKVSSFGEKSDGSEMTHVGIAGQNAGHLCDSNKVQESCEQNNPSESMSKVYCESSIAHIGDENPVPAMLEEADIENSSYPGSRTSSRPTPLPIPTADSLSSLQQTDTPENQKKSFSTFGKGKGSFASTNAQLPSKSGLTEQVADASSVKPVTKVSATGSMRKPKAVAIPSIPSVFIEQNKKSLSGPEAIRVEESGSHGVLFSPREKLEQVDVPGESTGTVITVKQCEATSSTYDDVALMDVSCEMDSSPVKSPVESSAACEPLIREPLYALVKPKSERACKMAKPVQDAIEVDDAGYAKLVGDQSPKPATLSEDSMVGDGGDYATIVPLASTEKENHANTDCEEYGGDYATIAPVRPDGLEKYHTSSTEKSPQINPYATSPPVAAESVEAGSGEGSTVSHTVKGEYVCFGTPRNTESNYVSFGTPQNARSTSTRYLQSSSLTPHLQDVQFDSPQGVIKNRSLGGSGRRLRKFDTFTQMPYSRHTGYGQSDEPSGIVEPADEMVVLSTPKEKGPAADGDYVLLGALRNRAGCRTPLQALPSLSKLDSFMEQASPVVLPTKRPVSPDNDDGSPRKHGPGTSQNKENRAAEQQRLDLENGSYRNESSTTIREKGFSCRRVPSSSKLLTGLRSSTRVDSRNIRSHAKTVPSTVQDRAKTPAPSADVRCVFLDG